MSIRNKWVARILVPLIAFFAMGAWFYLFSDKAHGAVQTARSSATVTKHCHIPWAVANSGVNIVKYCKKQNKSDGRMDPTLRYIYKCGGAAVIATWFVRRAKVGAATGALAACAWGSLFDGHHAAKKRAVHKAQAVRSRGCPRSPGMRAV